MIMETERQSEYSTVADVRMSTSTESPFDPYRKWLGIPQKDQPPHHYRLLGIAAFEDDLDVIENAAERQMAHVRRFQTGKHGEVSQQILNELASARGCLLDPARKNAYDGELRKGLEQPSESAGRSIAPPPPAVAANGAGPPPAAPPRDKPGVAAQPAPPTVPPAAPAPSFGGSARVAAAYRGRPRNKSSVLPIVVIAGIGGVAMIGLLALAASMARQRDVGGEPSRGASSVARASDGKGKAPQSRGKDQPRIPPPTTSGGGPQPPDPIPGLGTIPEPVPLLPDDPREGWRRPDAVLREARQALEAGNVAGAKELLTSISGIPHPLLKGEVNRLLVVASYIDGYHDSVQKGFASYQPYKRTELDPESETYVSVTKHHEMDLPGYEGTVVGFDNNTLTIETSEGSKTLALADLDSRQRFAMAERHARRDSFVNVQMAAYLLFQAPDDLFEMPGDKAERLALARRYYEAEGLDNPYLAPEFGRPVDRGYRPGGDGDFPLPPPGGDDDATSPEAPSDLGDLLDDPPIDGDGGDTGGDGHRRQAVPDAEELRAARARFNDVYRSGVVNARTPETKRALLGQLAARLGGEKDPAFKYVILERALALATEIPSPKAVGLVIDEMDRTYQVDGLSEKASSLSRCVAAAGTIEHGEEIFAASRDLYRQAVEMERYDVAATLARVAARAAGRANQPVARRNAEQEERRLDQVVQCQRDAKVAATRLTENPDDAAAHYKIGHYLALMLEQWDRGLPHLARGDNHEVKELALADLQTKEEKDGERLLDVGARWLTLARRWGGAESASAARRAIDVLQAAQQAGADRNDVEVPIREAKGLLERLPAPLSSSSDWMSEENG